MASVDVFKSIARYTSLQAHVAILLATLWEWSSSSRSFERDGPVRGGNWPFYALASQRVIGSAAAGPICLVPTK